MVLEHFDGRFELTVLDDGPGVEPEQLARLTERRVQGPGMRESSGLGLAIVSEVCRRFDWSLALANLEPEGFEVQLGGPLAAG